MIRAPSAFSVCGMVTAMIRSSSASSGWTLGGSHSAAPTRPTRYALPWSKATPPNAFAKPGKVARKSDASGQVHRVIGSSLNASVKTSKTAAASAAVAVSTGSRVIASRWARRWRPQGHLPQ
jgi:hypothetical protein